jgi:hypothetical protein
MRSACVLVLLVTLGCGTTPQPQAASTVPPSAQPTAAPAAVPVPPGSPTPPAQPAANPNQETNDRFAKQVAEAIAGHENEPAEQVFKNIQALKGVPAGRLVRIMNMGYSRALGVACTHCHVEQDFSSDDKRPKRAAREMMAMNKMINERLRTLQNLEGKPEEKFVSCTTCHRGQVDPNAGLR